MIKSLLVVTALIVGACITRSDPPFAQFPAGELIDLSHAYDARRSSGRPAETFRLDKVADGVTPKRLLLRREQLLHLRARRHAYRRAGAFRAGPQTVDRDSARSTDRRRRRRRRLGRERHERGPPGDGRPTSRHGSRRTASSPRLDRADPHRLFAPLARCRPLPGHGRARRRRRRRSCTSRVSTPTPRAGSSRNAPVKAIGIDTASIDFGQSTLLRIAPHAVRAQHPGVREPDGARPAARARRFHRRAADEDQRRQRRAAPRRGDPAALACSLLVGSPCHKGHEGKTSGPAATN